MSNITYVRLAAAATAFTLGMMSLAAPALAAEDQPMYRMYNMWSGEHHYTASAGERNALLEAGWRYEGSGWYAPTAGTQVYRLYNPWSGDHHYTTSPEEYDALGDMGWSKEGVSWHSDDSQATPLYRLFNPYVFIGTHHYTTSLAEYEALARVGWVQEGIAWYGVNQEDPSYAMLYDAVDESSWSGIVASGGAGIPRTLAAYRELYGSQNVSVQTAGPFSHADVPLPGTSLEIRYISYDGYGADDESFTPRRISGPLAELIDGLGPDESLDVRDLAARLKTRVSYQDAEERWMRDWGTEKGDKGIYDLACGSCLLEQESRGINSSARHVRVYIPSIERPPYSWVDWGATELWIEGNMEVPVSTRAHATLLTGAPIS